MEVAGSQRGLGLRLETLSARIRMLRRKVERTEGIDKILGNAEIGQLERRKKALEERVLKLNRESSGFRRSLKSEVAKLSYDVSSAVEDLMLLIDSGYGSDKPSSRGR